MLGTEKAVHSFGDKDIMPADGRKDMEMREREDPFHSQSYPSVHGENHMALKFLAKLFVNKL